MHAKRPKKHQRLGELLTEKRKEKNITQWEAGQHLGLGSSQYVSNFERGLCEPSIEHAVILAELYDIPRKQIYDILMDAYEAKIHEKIFAPVKHAKSRK